MSLFSKVAAGAPFIIENKNGATFIMAACNPYEKKWKNEKGVVFHSPYWYENNYGRGVFFVPGELNEVGPDEYELVNVKNGVTDVSKIYRLFSDNDRLWQDWLGYTKYKQVSPDENNTNALKNIQMLLKDEEEYDGVIMEINNKE